MEIHMFLCSTEYTGELIPTDKNVKEAKWVDIDEVGDTLRDEKDREFFLDLKKSLFILKLQK